jgi:small-conductance mechanosensitive channel
LINDMIFFDHLMFDHVIYTTSLASVTLGDLLKFVLILSLTILVLRIIILYLRRLLKDNVSKDVTETILKFFYYVSNIVVIITILPLLGLDPSGLLLAGSITGIILGFASQNIVGNLISGIFLMIEKPVKIGDQVDISGTSGIVTDIRIISTNIRTYDGLLVRIPNQHVFTSNITNSVVYPVRRFEIKFGIRYSDDADYAIRLIKDLIDKEPFVLLNPAPSIFVNELGESSVNLVARIWAPTSEWATLKTNLIWAVKKTLEENGIEFPFPQQVVYLHTVNEKNQTPGELKQNQEKEIESVLNYGERILT